MLEGRQKAVNPSSGNSPQSPHLDNVKGVGIADEIRKLSELKKQGLLTEDEFNDLKKKLLSN